MNFIITFVTSGGVHRGSEKHANMYAKSFVVSYNKIIDQIIKQNQIMNPNTKEQI